jgi:2,3-diketo-5-methylthio-1-phosphopentane phosphatase
MLILCDFDGTVTERDVTDLVWDDWISRSERERMVSEVLRNNWSMYQYIAYGYSHVRIAPERLLLELSERVRIRHGWTRFLTLVGVSNARLHIVSNGLDFYIRKYVPDWVPISCYSARFDETYRVELPPDCELDNRTEFKVNQVRQLIRDSGEEMVVYVGDGRADFEPALLCSRIFAVRESNLANTCRLHCINKVEFDSFDTVAECLALHSVAPPSKGSTPTKHFSETGETPPAVDR